MQLRFSPQLESELTEKIVESFIYLYSKVVSNYDLRYVENGSFRMPNRKIENDEIGTSIYLWSSLLDNENPVINDEVINKIKNHFNHAQNNFNQLCDDRERLRELNLDPDILQFTRDLLDHFNCNTEIERFFVDTNCYK